MTKRLTTQQKNALNDYEFAERQMDRYMGSVFVNSSGIRTHIQRVTAAYDQCRDLGMTWEHGL